MAEQAPPPEMTRRHFEFIAATLAAAAPWGESPAHMDAWLTVTEAFSDALELSNPAFDRARFLAACGVEL